MGSHGPAAVVGRMTRVGYATIGLAGLLGSVCLLTTYGFSWSTSGLVDGLTTLLPVPVAFGCGLLCRRGVGLVAAGWMAVTVELTQGYVNPFVLVITLGPWLVGAVLQDHRRITQRLAEVGRELEMETEQVADEAIRLERARIARELHDIVAHCVSLMVVQAYAGERLAGIDRTSATEAFGHIADAAGQAKEEIAHLVDLLSGEPAEKTKQALGPRLENLVAGASATGLDIRLHVAGHPERVSAAAAAVAYRVVQESLTNALKHSPGAVIHISVDCGADVVIDVMNSIDRSANSEISVTGGGHGLIGIRGRVSGLGGTFSAGPDDPGVWRVSVQFPASSRVTPGSRRVRPVGSTP
jgi:signal transduction histidine kinase